MNTDQLRESFPMIMHAGHFERAKLGVFHHLSKKHLPRYLDEIGFRWNHRIPKEKVNKNDIKKTVMIPMPVMNKLQSLLDRVFGRQIRRTINGGIRRLNPVCFECGFPFFGI